MDYMGYNREQLNSRRIRKVSRKVMVFIIPSLVKVGPVQTEVRFPYKGRLINSYASCGTSGTTPTTIDIEKCAQEAYDTTPRWESVFQNKISINANNKSNRTSTKPYSFKPSFETVYENDHFRVNVIEAGEGVRDITVELVVELDVEEE
ncbi:hypothetical protein BXO87_02115 [Bacillus sp. GZB]|uniref:hypothetical protein n=1 Tax=Bacillus TaxID=1386 RepID=UPI000975A6D0|nr:MULTISPECIES: hypothetical protein [Bacillus]MCZ4246921.1 hypothetical protein [Bacillus amyloliquefaciens]OMQ06822.1 hypothetical protein BXO87_02115 [Bacillus sp. GZB]